jgi:hypothetical protein
MLKLVFDKYVLGLHWRLQLSPDLAVYRQVPGADGEQQGSPIVPCLTFLESILGAIELQLKVCPLEKPCPCFRNICHHPWLYPMPHPNNPSITHSPPALVPGSHRLQRRI